jgi:hypothetical protein
VEKQEIWKMLNEQRSNGGRFDFSNELVNIISEYCDDFVTQRLIEYDLNAFVHEHLIPPVEVIKAVLELLSKLDIDNALDLFTTLGSPITYSKGIKVVSKGFAHLHEYINVIRNDIDFVEEEHKVDKYDLLTYFGPIKYKKSSVVIDGNRYKIDYALEIIKDNIVSLNDEGKVLVVLTDIDLQQLKEDGFFQAINLYPEAVFSLVADAFKPLTFVKTNIVLLSKIKRENIFIAELTRNMNQNAKVINNFINGKTQKNLRHGLYTKIEKVDSIERVLDAIEIEKRFRRIPYEQVKFNDIVINSCNLRQDRDIPECSNRIFFPALGTKEIVSDISELTGRLDNYYLLELDPQKAIAEFIAFFFSTDLGKQYRKNLTTGHIPRVTRKNLLESEIQLPPVDIQHELLVATKRLDTQLSYIETLKSELWNSMDKRKLKVVEDEFYNWEMPESLEAWLDTLPYPLAKVLWKYNSSASVEKKIESLFFFFESLSEFLCILLLSAYKQDDDFYKEHKRKWNNNNKSNSNWYMQSSFGQWNVLFNNLSKIARGMANSDKKDYVLRLLGNPPNEYQNIFSNNIKGILGEAVRLRNMWKGHGGAYSVTEAARRLGELEQLLDSTRVCLKDAFRRTHLVYQVSGRKYEDGCKNKVLLLNGTRTPFIEETITSDDVLYSEQLYIYHEGSYRPTRLYPLLKFEANYSAFYFYSSCESSKMKWVSYHYEETSEILTDYSEKLLEAFITDIEN